MMNNLPADRKIAMKAKSFLERRILGGFERMILESDFDKYQSNEKVSYDLEFQTFQIVTNSKIPYKNGSLN